MKFAVHYKKIIPRAFVSVLVLAAALLSYYRVFDLFELQTYDYRCHLRGTRLVSPDIVIIEIADDTLSKLGEWPINREYYAWLIEALEEAGAKAVAFDILFTDPNPQMDPFIFSAAKHFNRTYFSIALQHPKSENGSLRSEKILTPLVSDFAAVARRVGFVNVVTDRDSKRRRVPLVIHQDNKRYFYLPLAVALDVLGVPEENVREVPGKYLELNSGLRLPVDSQGHFFVSFAGTWANTFKHYSFADIILAHFQKMAAEKPFIDLSLFKGKICFVGLTATASFDMNGVPLEPIYPGVGIHLNVLNTILTRDFIQRLSPINNLIIVFILMFIVSFVSLRLKPLRAFLHMISITGLYVSIALAVFYYDGLWMDLVCPVFMSIATYLGTTLVKILSEMKKRQQIENELKVASQIQKSFLPERLPATQGISLAAYFKPAKAVGGDLYSFIPFGEKKVGVMLGDVSGKGTPAALFMSKVVSEFKFSSRGQTDPARVLTRLNDAISSESTGGLFVTLTYVIFDLESAKLVMTNGGHLPLVRAGAGGETELVQAEEGMPVGVMEGVTFANFERTIQAGDCYAFYSDGVSEARNKKKDEFGIEALQAALSRYRTGTASEILKKVVQDLEHFMGKADQHDDITLIIAKIDPTS